MFEMPKRVLKTSVFKMERVSLKTSVSKKHGFCWVLKVQVLVSSVLKSWKGKRGVRNNVGYTFFMVGWWYACFNCEQITKNWEFFNGVDRQHGSMQVGIDFFNIYGLQQQP